jgi:outer membrane protein OmpA-like peptidoglycan-associated protein
MAGHRFEVGPELPLTTRPVRVRPGAGTAWERPGYRLLHLQQLAGNRAVTSMLAPTPGARVRVPVQRCGPVACGCSAAERAEAELESHRTGTVTAQRAPLAPVAVQRLSEGDFRTQLGSTPQQRGAISALFGNATFLALWNYLRTCGATPKADLGPLHLAVTPGLQSSGVERFGGYDPVSRTLEINPTKPEHRDNPTELVDTITHELIHAVDDLQPDCVAAGSGPAPLAGGATATPPARASVAGTAAEQALNVSQGPGASDPCGEFIDINAAAQNIVIAVMRDNVQVATVGRPTVTFVNVIIRRDPAALTFYETCRTAACGRSGGARRAALAHCSAETIGRFIPPDLTDALLPSRLHFDHGVSQLRADDSATLELIGIFLLAHPASRVRLVGHADPTGSTSVNVAFGQARANEIRRRLRAAGVPSGQITSVTSRGSADRLSTGPDTFWQDRRVEVLP